MLNGMKLLGTGAPFADEVWVGNLLPLSPDQKGQAVTCAVPIGARGQSLGAQAIRKVCCNRFR